MAKGYKWWRTVYLRRNPTIAEHLPATLSLTEGNLFSMLNRYQKVIVKPTSGYGGMGIIQISREKNGSFTLHRNASQTTVPERARLYPQLISWKNKRSYMVQQRIPLARINGRPFDVRVMVQKGKDSGWTVTGQLAKIAGPGYIVTNVKRSKGTVTTVASAINRSNITVSSESIQARLKELALQTAERLGQKYPKQRMFGIDMGIDEEGKVWIIESNFAPSVSLFKKLKDKSDYYRILKFRRS